MELSPSLSPTLAHKDSERQLECPLDPKIKWRIVYAMLRNSLVYQRTRWRQTWPFSRGWELGYHKQWRNLNRKHFQHPHASTPRCDTKPPFRPKTIPSFLSNANNMAGSCVVPNGEYTSAMWTKDFGTTLKVIYASHSYISKMFLSNRAKPANLAEN